jgi:probable rRNA maturation factor
MTRSASTMDDQPTPPSTSRAPRVLVSDRQDAPIDLAGLAHVAERTLAGEGVEEGELSLSFVGAAEMAYLHVRYLGESGPTDVLSFPLGEDGLIGDVIVCPEEARRNNPVDLAGELRLLVAHGVLHLLGYDHEEEDAQRVMWRLQANYSGVKAE